MTITIAVDRYSLSNLDLSPVEKAIEKPLQEKAIGLYEQQVQFDIEYDREPDDPRELSEIPEVQLWFTRLDARYPWMPFLLDWKAGELARYTAMLIPHEFHPRTHEIQYNLQALEIFINHKIFVLTDWLAMQGIPSKSRLKSMALVFGYELDDALFDLISTDPI